jgi:S-adenosylmethionine:tRNA ribosyltransferase-isomerase
VGPGTFKPVKAERAEEHRVDPEPYFIPAATVRAIRETKRAGGRVIAVGTTSLRTLEGAAERLLSGEAAGEEGWAGTTDLYVYPPYRFRVACALQTNFHIPRSSLMLLVSAFAEPGGTGGVGLLRRAYEHAVEQKYRFYSYGDATLIV